MKSVITIDAALRDPQLLGVGLGDPASWKVWLVTLRAAFGLRLTAAQQKSFTPAPVIGRHLRSVCASCGALSAGVVAKAGWRLRLRFILPVSFRASWPLVNGQWC